MKQTRNFGLLQRLFSTGTSKKITGNPLAPAGRRDPELGPRGRSEDSPQAIEHLERAAETGDPVAQNRFGLGLIVAAGLLQNNEQARRWLRRAAQQGYAEAQFNLGNLYQSASLQPSSTGGGEARIEAYVWFQLASAQGHAQATAACEMLNLQLTDAELAEGNRRAKGFEFSMEAPSQRTHPST